MIIYVYAVVLELADKKVSNTFVSNDVWVRVPPTAPKDNIVAPDEKTIKSTVKGRFFSCLSIEIFGKV